MSTCAGGAALLAARLRVIARQHQQHALAAGAGAIASWPSPLLREAPAPLLRRPPFFSAAASMSTTTAPAAETAPPSATAATADHHHQQTKHKRETPSSSLPPGASPLLPVREAAASASFLSRAGAFSAPPRPLTYARGLYRYPESLEGNAFGRAILRLTGSYTRRQTLRNGAVVLWDAIAERGGGGDPDLARAFGLHPRAFMTTWYLESLCVWLVVNRLKLEGAAEAADFQQHLYTHLYQPDVARRVRAAPGVVAPYSGKWLRRLEQVFYGMALAYDRAIVGGDGGGLAAGEPAGAGGTGASAGAGGALSLALVRNVYGGDGAYAPSADLLARYLCRQLQCLAMTPTEDLYLGQVRFGGVEGAKAGELLRVPAGLGEDEGVQAR